MAPVYVFGPFRLDAGAGILFRGAQPLPLGRRGVAILCALVEQDGMPVSKDALVEAAWPGLAVEDSNLTVQIAGLRRMLSQESDGRSWIETLPRRGYRFLAPARREDDGAAERSQSKRGPVHSLPDRLPIADLPLPDAATKSVAPRRDDEASSAAVYPGSPERRQLTIMVCTMVDSMSASAGLDPEDMHDQIARFHKMAADVVARFDGFVAQYLNDGVLVYFGYPAAHEHDAEQAVRAGLALLEAAGTLRTSSGMPLKSRAGIATGLVVVDEQLGADETRHRVAIGEAANLSAQLEAMAAPGEVIISDSTRRLVGRMFNCCPVRANEAKGPLQLAEAWRVRDEAAGVSRFEARRAGELYPLVGRQEEIDLLLRRWDHAKLGEGRVVLLSGEPGIGKSRIVEGLLVKIECKPYARIRYSCSPNHRHSPLYPFIAQLERAAGFEPGSSVGAKLDKLGVLLRPTTRTLPGDVALVAELPDVPTDGRYAALAVSPQQKRETLEQTSTSIEDAALIADMLLLPNDGRYPALELTPEERRKRTLTALVSQLTALTRHHPVLMIFEDAHWSDPTSLEVLGRVIDLIGTLRLLLIVTFRPEFDPPWIGRPDVTALTINRLGERDIGAMIDCIVGNQPLPSRIRQDIIERTDGIPLFVEEMTKSVLEAESEVAAAQAVARAPSPTLAVPASLHASLMARLDRLGPTKEVAQIGAAIGREFSHPLLALVTRRPESELRGALDRLIAAGLLYRQGVPPHATYRFKHALVQDAAYGTLLREPRRALHARITEVLEGDFAEIADSQPELLARHCTEAGLIEKAAGLWGKAGQRSLERSALVEAIEQFRRALAQIAILPAAPTLRREQIKLQIALVNAVRHTKGYGASDTKAAMEQARLFIEQAEALGDTPKDPLLLFSVLYGFWAADLVAFNGDMLRELAAQFLALAEKQGATAPLMLGHAYMGTSLLFTGDFVQARTHFDKAIALYDPAVHRPLATRFGQDLAVSILSYRSRTLWFLGYPEAALKDADDALKIAREVGEAATLMFALGVTAVTQIICGNYPAAAAQAQRLATEAEQKGSLYWKALAIMQQGSLLVLTGKAAEAVQMLTLAIASWRSTGSTLYMPLYLSYLARAHVGLGQFEEASRCIGEAMTGAETAKERWCQADIHRTAGEFALMLPEPDAAKAEAHLEQALTIAREQNAKSWELRVATSIARLWRNQGKRQQARDLLAPIYGWFTEGLDTRDLKEATALLDELAK